MTRVLIVDDQEANLYYLESLLGGHGFTVESARHGAEALLKARLNQPDLIISDLLMPVMDGYTLLRNWKFDTRLKTIPFIVYTATYTEVEDKELALNMGADAFILKPAEPAVFIARVGELLASAAREVPGPLNVSNGDESGLLKVYSERLIRKLEEKTLQLETANEALEAELAERKTAEVAMQRAVRRLNNAQRLGQIGDWEWEMESEKITWSAQVFEIVGRDPRLGPPRSFEEQCGFYDATSRETLRERIARAIKTGEPQSYELVLIRTSGESIPVQAMAVPRKDASGRIIGFYGTIQNIAERKRAQARIVQQAALIDEARDAILVRDLDNKLIFWSKGAERIFGWSAAEAVGRQVHELLQPDPVVFANALTTVKREGAWSGELRKTTRAGESITLESRWTLLRDGTEQPISILEISTDITARKLLEEQFRHAQKMEAIGTLAGGIAHDFNNILSAIVGNNRLALMDLEQEHPARESLQEVDKAAKRARELVQQILSFSRRQPQEQRVIALAPVVQETGRLLRATIPASVELDITVASDVPNIRADASQIQQVLLNLSTNAWHALEDQPGRIDIQVDAIVMDPQTPGTPPGLAAGLYARILITDTGRGMNAETVERIFEPFFTTKPVGKGTGLGLAVVHGIVQAHSGGIEVRSKPGVGTTFGVYLPASAENVESVPERSLTPQRGNGQHVLYLDDEESLVYLARRALERMGYKVTGFSSPPEALKAFREAPDRFDLVITDFNMPGTSGLRVSGEMLAIRRDIPIILSSGYITEELVGNALAIGIQQVIYKPSTVEEMSETIHQFATRAVQR